MRQAAARSWMVFPSWVGHAAVGLAGGAILGNMAVLFLVRTGFATRLGMRTEPGELFWLAAAVGGGIGMVAGMISGHVAQRRAAHLAENASRVGAQFSEHDDEVQRALQSDFPQRHVFMQNVMRKDLVDLRFSVGDLSITRREGSGSGRGERTIRQTAAYYRRDELAMPRFTLEPAGVVRKFLSWATSFQGLRFPGHREFESQYSVLATDVADTRALLNGAVLAWLAAHPGLHVEAGGHGVIAYRQGQVLHPDEVPIFVDEAAELFRLLRPSQRQIDFEPVEQPSPDEQLSAFAAQLPPLLGKEVMAEIRGRLVSRQDVEAFARQPPPRTIPANVARYCEDFAPTMAIAIGAAFVAAGALVGMALAAQGNWLGVSIGGLFFLIGAALVGFLGRIRWRLNRILRRGELVIGRIDQVESANFEVNGREVYNLSARYRAGGQEVVGRCKLLAPAGERLKALAAQGKPVAILRDPAGGDRIVVIDALVNA